MLKSTGTQIQPPAIQAVDLFCGVGGLSLGLKQSGIDVVAGFDLDPACKFAYEDGVKSPFELQDVSLLTGDSVNSYYSSGAVRLLAGCAPCQPFSRYNSGRKGQDDRWNLLLEFLRVASESEPDIVTMENVPDLRTLDLWSAFTEGLESLGFKVRWAVLNAADYGVPQHRQRLVLLGSKLGPIDLPSPEPQQATVETAISNLPHIEAGEQDPHDALHQARRLSPLNLERIRHSKPAGTWRDWPTELVSACHKTPAGRTFGSVYGRMSWEKPSPTITTQFYGFGNGRFGHPEQDRAISLREGALLQSFPSGFKFVDPAQRITAREVGRLIGNAVPPKLGLAIGGAIQAHVAENYSVLQ